MEQSLKSISLRYGLILGLVLILVTVVAYVIDIEFLVNWWLNLLIMPVVIIGFGVVSAAKSKSILNGFIGFKQAFSSYFITVAIAIIISTLFSVILFNYIDPDSAVQLKEIVIEKTMEFMEKFDTPQAQMDEAILKLENQDTFAITTQLRSLAQSLIFFTVIGLIVALIMKKKDPDQA